MSTTAASAPAAVPSSAARPSGELEGASRWVVAGTVLTGTIMAVLDSSIVNVSLPTMGGTLGASIQEITWVVTGYILANVIIMPIIATLSARFGRKRFYLLSIVLFTGASMACGAARSLPLMVFFRIFQGLGGGVLMTVSQAILRESFPANEQGTAMGIYGMGAVLAPAVGPTLGGWLTDNFSWPWIFYINVPVGILCVLLVSRFVHDPPYLVRTKERIDGLGIGLLTVGLGSLQLMLEQGQEKDWFDSPLVVSYAVAAALGLAVFAIHELTVDRPAVSLRLLGDASFTSATVLAAILGMGLNCSLFLLPVFFQNVLRLPAMESGLALMPRSLAMLVLMPIGGRLYNRLGPRVLVGVGLAISTLAFWQLAALAPQMGAWDIVVPQVLQGVGFSLVFVALSTAALSNVEKKDMTAATGLYNVVRQVAGSVGIAVGATLLESSTVRYVSTVASHVSETSLEARQWLAKVSGGMVARGFDAVSAKAAALRLLGGDVLRQAAVLAYNHIFYLITALFAVSMPLVLLLRRPQGNVEVELGAE